jgi:hypothetical protein
MGFEYNKSKQLRMTTPKIIIIETSNYSTTKQQQRRPQQNNHQITTTEDTAEELISLQTGEGLRNHQQESQLKNHLSSETSETILTLKFRDSKLANLLQENMICINNSSSNIQQMVTTLETETDNDHSNFSNGVMGSSRPNEETSKKSQHKMTKKITTTTAKKPDSENLSSQSIPQIVTKAAAGLTRRRQQTQ